MNLLKMIFGKSPSEEEILAAETSECRDIFRNRSGLWYFALYGEMLRSRRDQALSRLQQHSHLNCIAVSDSETSTRLRSTANRFGAKIINDVEVWIANQNKLFGRGQDIEVSKFVRSAQQYGAIVEDACECERIVNGLKSNNKQIVKIVELLNGCFLRSLQPILDLPEKLVLASSSSGAKISFQLDFKAPRELGKANDLIKRL